MKWETYKLKQLCSEIVDCVNKTAPTSNVPTPYKMLRTSDIRDGKINLENLNCVTKEVYEKWTRRGKLQKGDVIFTREAPLGEVGLVREEKNYFLGQRLVLFRANDKMCDGRFLMYSLLWHDNKQAIISKGVGSTVAHLRVPECENIEIKVPDLDAQHRIADILSAYDDLIENNQKQIKLLEEAAQRLYKEWFVDLRFPGHENTKIVDGVPEEWRKFPLEEIALVVTGKKDANYGDKGGNYPFFTCSQETITAPGYSFDTSAVILAGNGDFNVKLYRGKFEAYQRTYVLAPFDHSNLFNLYFTVQDNMEALAKGASGSTIKFLTKGMLQKILVLTADKKILDKFNDYEENIQQKVEALKKQVEDLTEIRNRLLPKLMSGEVEV